jgi:hypothetical protein
MGKENNDTDLHLNNKKEREAKANKNKSFLKKRSIKKDLFLYQSLIPTMLDWAGKSLKKFNQILRVLTTCW